jgi:signal transduction histidine kinase
MTLRKKLWMVLIIIMIIPFLTNVFVVDRILNKDESLTGMLIYDSGYFDGFLAIQDELNHYVDQHEPFSSSTIGNIPKEDALYNDEFAGVIVYKEGKTIYRSAFFENSDYDQLVDQLSHEDDPIRIESDLLLFEKMDVLFDDATRGKIIYGIDSAKITETSERYWLTQGAWLTGITMVLLILAVGYILRSVNQSVLSMGLITRKLKEGNLNESLTYNREDEFKELADEIEHLRVSLKASLDKQRELEEDKRKMIGDISHDLRTPLTAIGGYAQALGDQVARSEEERDEYLKIIQQKVGVIENLIMDLKALSDIDMEKSKLMRTRISINEFLMDCVEELSHDIEMERAHITYDDQGQEVFVEADVLKLSRVFMNIIQNALKYNEGQEIAVAISGVSTPESFVITVEDSGVGVMASSYDKIFERFFREDQSRNSEIGGSGIGLTICKDLIEAHGGKIRAGRASIGGLAIEITLPRV